MCLGGSSITVLNQVKRVFSLVILNLLFCRIELFFFFSNIHI